MRPFLFFAGIALAGYSAPLTAQNPPAAPTPARPTSVKQAGVIGDWNGKTMVGPKDSVVAAYVPHATASDSGWTLTFPGRDPIPTRVVARGGDSVVTETGPYNSVLRPGQMVTTRTTGHISGDTMTGTFVAHYASGDVLQGKISATRKK